MAQLCECLVLPGVALTTVGGEFGNRVCVVRGVLESAARPDLGELVVVAGEQDATAAVDVPDNDLGERADVCHACLVDDQEAAVWLGAAAFPTGQQRVHRGGSYAGCCTQLDRRAR